MSSAKSLQNSNTTQTVNKISPEVFFRQEIDYVVRLATKQDLLALIHLERQSGMEDIWSVKAFKSILEQPSNYILLAEKETFVIGYIAILIQPQNTIIVSLVVDPKYQRNKIATRLIHHLQSLPAPAYRPRIDAAVRESLTPTHLLLKSCGFKCLDTDAKLFDSPPETAYLFSWIA